MTHFPPPVRTQPVTTPDRVLFATDRFKCTCWDRGKRVRWCDHLALYFLANQDVGQYELTWRNRNHRDLYLPLGFGVLEVPCVATIRSMDPSDLDADLVMTVTMKDNASVCALMMPGDGLNMFLATMNSYYSAFEEYEYAYTVTEEQHRRTASGKKPPRGGQLYCANESHNWLDTTANLSLAKTAGSAGFAVANAYTVITTGCCVSCYRFKAEMQSGIMGLQDL